MDASSSIIIDGDRHHSSAAAAAAAAASRYSGHTVRRMSMPTGARSPAVARALRSRQVTLLQ